VKIVRALETQDPLLIEEANGMLEEARSLLREYQNEIDKLAKEHDVEWEEKDTTSSL
jgi:exonuclease VII small subunit